MGVLTRTEWVKLRDKVHKVKKGAVSGVSMGDALDSYHKEADKGLEAAVKAAPKLETACEKYSKSCKSDGLKKDIKSKILDQLTAIEKCLPFLKEIAAVKTAWLAFKKQPSEPGRATLEKLITPLRENGKKKYPAIKGVESSAHGVWKWVHGETAESVLAHGTDIEHYIKELEGLR